MSPELDKRLCEEFPEIFKNRHAPMSKTCMCWGFDVGDGWYDIIHEACEKLEQLRFKTGMVVYAEQVKEKFGTLRFYINEDGRRLKLTKSQRNEVWENAVDIVSEAEVKSSKICEECGNTGNINKRGWKVTLCDECRKARFKT